MFNYEVKPADALTAKFWENEPRMSDAEFFHRSAKRTFGTSTTLGLAATEAEITLAENREGTRDQVYELFNGAGEDELNGIDVSRHAHALSEDDWKASAHYDKRLPWSPTMTETRARILKENLDRRDAEDKELAREGQGVWRDALSFGAGMAAALPDPINLLPFGAGIKAATLGKAALQGAKAGVAGNLAADAVIFPWAQSHGEEAGFTDLLKDGIFGAALGMGFGMFGHGFSRWLGSRRRHAERSEASIPAPFDELPDSFLTPGEERQRSEMPEDGFFADAQNDGAQRLRNELLGQDRVNAGRLVDAVLRDIGEDRSLDIQGHAQRMGLDGPVFMPDGRPPLRTDTLIGNEARPFWGGLDIDDMLPLAERYYIDTLSNLPPIAARGGREINIRTPRQGWRKIRGLVPDADKLKLLPYIDRILAEAEWVFTEPTHHDGAARQGVKMHDLLAAVEYDGKILEVRLKVREAGNGKFFYDFFNESEPSTGQKKPRLINAPTPLPKAPKTGKISRVRNRRFTDSSDRQHMRQASKILNRQYVTPPPMSILKCATSRPTGRRNRLSLRPMRQRRMNALLRTGRWTEKSPALRMRGEFHRKK